ncbi:peptidylprolyl isomerase [Cyberlindnera jadinii NRRL Y-1542]|uniref:Peptidyl-prolyl cis-trans isomerase n=1 Tax=Cyberlindnera jadinii (strain ATCC 18201 / CBS 1600 / BCRC 20928 / JCM 3617 / NBRC 0987 / NRRL Y-1542) TaxID=983966 RepID=A0A1E4SA98_CYBJN|nr:peptidylprolyl isomerase-like protein [Cyberlindnera jadinii NRRL Y-1542]ODV76424.1 peptidylprolyl isomerase-like protein [Cyberlindnera jadinii NRRL Y-1542]
MSVTLHTDSGDIKIEVFCEKCPRTAENFLAHCAMGTYTGTKVVRNIKGFMVQFGDPTNTGKGGESIWGGKFEDEIRQDLKHDSRGTVAMANTGPNTNGSQFYITYGKHSSLDGKYTVFGKVLMGAENEPGATLSRIENVSVDKKSRPKVPIYIRDVTIHANPIASRQK